MTSASLRSRRWLAVLAAVALILSACGSGGSTDTAASPASTTATEAASSYPQFSAPTIEGTQLELGSLEGQDTVLWFWAPW